jgi:transcriptional regulator with XRE-family HTH domain
MILRWHEGDVVRKLRNSLDWTLQDLATTSGVNIQVIHKLEAGVTKEAKRTTLARIARAFGLTERHLLDATPAPREMPVKAARRARRTVPRLVHARTTKDDGSGFAEH